MHLKPPTMRLASKVRPIVLLFGWDTDGLLTSGFRIRRLRFFLHIQVHGHGNILSRNTRISTLSLASLDHRNGRFSGIAGRCDFHQHLSTHNPLSLKLLHKAVMESGAWPITRFQLFGAAVAQLAHEHRRNDAVLHSFFQTTCRCCLVDLRVGDSRRSKEERRISRRPARVRNSGRLSRAGRRKFAPAAGG